MLKNISNTPSPQREAECNLLHSRILNPLWSGISTSILIAVIQIQNLMYQNVIFSNHNDNNLSEPLRLTKAA